jgi:hypothetical protein
LVSRLMTHLDGPLSEENLAHAVKLIMGFTYVSGSPLVMLEAETGVPGQEMLRNLAVQYAQDCV